MRRWGDDVCVMIGKENKQKGSCLQHLRPQKTPLQLQQTWAGMLQQFYSIHSLAQAAPCPHHRKDQPDWGQNGTGDGGRMPALLLLNIARQDKI